MKKVLAVVLAVLMLATVAFAAVELDELNKVWTPVTDATVPVFEVYPGAKISFADDMMDFLWGEWDNRGTKTQKNSKYFNVAIVFEKGEDLVKSQGWDGDKYVVELNDFDAVNDNDSAELVIKSVTATLKLDSKNHFMRFTRKDDSLVYDTCKINGDTPAASPTFDELVDQHLAARWDVGYDYVVGFVEVDFDSLVFNGKWKDKIGNWKTDADNYIVTYSPNQNTPYYKAVDADGDYHFVDVVEGVDDLALDIEGTLAKGRWMMLCTYDKGRGDYDKMLDAYDVMTEDANYAYLFGFEGTDLKTKATMTLGANKDAFIYAIDKDGKLSDSGFKWDDDNDVWTKSTRNLTGCYVLSDIELKSAAAGDSTNPDTGANDIVGIASALAVVAVISAAAISLKK